MGRFFDDEANNDNYYYRNKKLNETNQKYTSAKVGLIDKKYTSDGGSVSYGASALTAGVYNGDQRNCALGVDASLIRVEAQLKRLSVGCGLNFDTGACVGRDGVGLSLFGTGFKIGKETKLKTPYFDVGFKFKK